MHYDTVIIGCGTAGSILASHLTEDPAHTVCAIEAGHDYSSIDELPMSLRAHRSNRAEAGKNPNDPKVVGFPDWGFTARSTELQPDVPLPRGKVIGGSSSVNGGVFFRGLSQDFNEWAAAGNPSWTPGDCLPFFKSIEHDYDFADEFHGSAGPIPVHRTAPEGWAPLNVAFYQACLSLGYPECPDFNRPGTWGVGSIPRNIHEHTRYGALIGFLLPVRERPNLTIIADALATRIVISGGAAQGVEVIVDGRPELIEADQVLLTAGAVGSPHLLMLSGVGPAEHLRSFDIPVVADLPGVGQNLRDHPTLCASWAAHEITYPAEVGATGQVGMRGDTPGSADPLDMRLMSFRTEGQDRFGIPFSLMHAASAGELRLVSADPGAAPAIDMRHLQDPSDRARMRAMLEVAIDVIDQAAFKDYRLGMLEPGPDVLADDAALEAWMLRNVITGEHISSTCKMGPQGDPMAVADETGRVHGIGRLRVIDVSLMPDCPRVNTNATTMMMAEKLAATLVSPDAPQAHPADLTESR
jgi:choline dehydrogenase